MNEFDLKAKGWDDNPMHFERSKAVSDLIISNIPLDKNMNALEFGAGTGITSFMLNDRTGSFTMMDSSLEMVNEINRKIASSGAKNMHAVLFDLEKNRWQGEKFDLIVTQMVLHHITDTHEILNRFNNMITPGGWLAIADLFPEDGTFHSGNFTGHRGFDPVEITGMLEDIGFTGISHSKCFTITKKTYDDQVKQFDVFLLLARKAR